MKKEKTLKDCTGLEYPECPSCGSYMYIQTHDVETLRKFVKPLDGQAPNYIKVIERKPKKDGSDIVIDMEFVEYVRVDSLPKHVIKNELPIKYEEDEQ